ncbi:MAG: hypothetical protein V2A73_12595, partial [Pseudomonadota bacterium]
MSMWNRILSFGLVCASCVPACTDAEEHHATLLAADAGTENSESSEAQNRRQRMSITGSLVVTDARNPSSWTGTAYDIARSFAAIDCLHSIEYADGGNLGLGCSEEKSLFSDKKKWSDKEETWCKKSPGEVPLCEPDPAAKHDCKVAVCRVQVATCIAHRLLEIESSVVPVSIKGGGLGPANYTTLTIPPQDEESKVALTEEAFKYAAWAATVAGNNLRSMVKDKKTYDSSIVGVCDSSAAKTPLLLERSYSEWLASSLSEATLVADEAARTAVQHHLAVADATFSEVPDLGEATRMAWVDGDISRARAAHILFGGQFDKGLKDTPKGFCPVEPLSDTAKEAQSVIQAVGPSPSVVYDPNVSFIDLFAGVPKPTGSTALDDSLRARLSERSGNPSFATMVPAEFLKIRGLSEADFVEARNYMAHEAKAFARD